jgi:hypothetical protein
LRPDTGRNLINMSFMTKEARIQQSVQEFHLRHLILLYECA